MGWLLFLRWGNHAALDEIWVSTDEQEIEDIANAEGCSVLRRSEDFAQAESPSILAVQEFVRQAPGERSATAPPFAGQ